mgnify:CR=1 FL=1
MFFAVITILPEMFASITDFGITGRALARKQAEILLINPRDFTTDNYRRIDERPFGGGPGMVMMAEPLQKAIDYAKTQANARGKTCPVVYLSPQGKTLSESRVLDFCQYDGLILLCGRYEGIDERLLSQYVDIECSIGDYVLTGGELPAMLLIDAVARRIPGVLGSESSLDEESFDGGLLEYPQYTRTPEYRGWEVPPILLSGHHAEVEKWRRRQRLLRTRDLRPDLLEHVEMTEVERRWLQEQP